MQSPIIAKGLDRYKKLKIKLSAQDYMAFARHRVPGYLEDFNMKGYLPINIFV